MKFAKYDTDLTDAQWNFIEPLLPKRRRRGRPPADRRSVIDAIFYFVKGGIPWRLLPTTFPPWKTIYHIFREWTLNGTWEALNDLEWNAASIVELYRGRWQIEVFFKQIKQTLQLADFLGTSANAVRWRVWTALLAYLLLRYLSFLSDWSYSFSRLFTLIRTCLWRKWDLRSLLDLYGTADGQFRYIA